MRLVLRRVALYVVTAIVAITINFFLPRLLPGNPALAVLGKAQSAESPQAVAALEAPRRRRWPRLAVTSGPSSAATAH
jgi:peptide/nickel transport system permease protein